ESDRAAGRRFCRPESNPHCCPIFEGPSGDGERVLSFQRRDVSARITAMEKLLCECCGAASGSVEYLHKISARPLRIRGFTEWSWAPECVGHQSYDRCIDGRREGISAKLLRPDSRIEVAADFKWSMIHGPLLSWTWNMDHGPLKW